MHFAQHLVDREHHVGGSEGLAVVPFHTVLQLERVGQAVRRDLPRLGQLRARLEVRAVGQQALVDLAGDVLRGRLRVHRADQDRRLGLHDAGQGAANGLRNGAARGQEYRCQGQAGGCQRHRHQAFTKALFQVLGEVFHRSVSCGGDRDLRSRKTNARRLEDDLLRWLQAVAGSTPHQSCMNCASVVATRTMLSMETDSSMPWMLRASGP